MPTPNTPALHPAALRFATMLAAADGPPFEQMRPEDMRAAARAFAAFAIAPRAQVASVTDLALPGEAGPIPVRLYRPPDPAAAMANAAIVFFHGGGWIICDLDSHDDICRALCAEIGCTILAVDYRLAPEHPFPAAVEDAFSAVRWLAQESRALGIDPARIAVAGDSAGGNLAAVTAIAAARGELPPVACQILWYPVVDLSREAPSYSRCEFGLQLTAGAMRAMRALYVPADADTADWRISPLRAETLAGVAPSFILTVHHDPLCDEGIAYAQRLAEEGNVVTHVHLSGHMHGLISVGGMLADGRAAISMAATAVCAALAHTNEDYTS